MGKDPQIAIIGAGVGGLVTALHLHAHGFKNISLFEAAGQLVSLGVGINVQPHAVLVLRNLGLLPRLEAIGIETQVRYSKSCILLADTRSGYCRLALGHLHLRWLV